MLGRVFPLWVQKYEIMLQKSLVNHINDLLTCQLNIIAGFGWHCFEQCLNIMTYIKACLKIICFPPCTLDFACACWRKGGGRTKWERLVTSVLISLSRVDNTYWNKSDIVQNNYRATLEGPNCASVQNSPTGQHAYNGKSRDRKKKASTPDLNSASTQSPRQQSPEEYNWAQQSVLAENPVESHDGSTQLPCGTMAPQSFHQSNPTATVPDTSILLSQNNKKKNQYKWTHFHSSTEFSVSCVQYLTSHSLISSSVLALCSY